MGKSSQGGMRRDWWSVQGREPRTSLGTFCRDVLVQDCIEKGDRILQIARGVVLYNEFSSCLVHSAKNPFLHSSDLTRLV